jgi:Fe-S cluster assembly protein SufD
MRNTLAEPSAVDAYLAAYRDAEPELLRNSPPSVQRLRKAAIACFGEIGFPDERNEDWKFTNLAPILRTSFCLPPQSPDLASAYRNNLHHNDETGATFACINSTPPFLLQGSRPLPKNVRLLSLSGALRICPELIERYLGQIADFSRAPFTALNTAFWRDGFFLYVPPDVVLEEPIHLWTFVTPWTPWNGAFYLWHRRCLIILDRCSQATIVEKVQGVPIVYATNAVTEIILGEGAQLDHCKEQRESLDALHIATTQAVLSRDSRFTTHFVGLGGKLVRNEVRVLFTGQNCEATVNGLYRAGDQQHMDNHTVIDHAQPHCASHELYKGILDDKAHGVFNGKIFVRQDAQKTDAKQTNQTLLLSDDAVINTKPQLEIFADDVKCTHGATVGQLDAEALFYLRSRGIGAEQARNLLTYAFANDILGRIQVESVRRDLERAFIGNPPEAADIPAEEEP